MNRPPIPLRGGQEQDMLTRWRRFCRRAAGVVRKSKRSYWRRVRRWRKLGTADIP